MTRNFASGRGGCQTNRSKIGFLPLVVALHRHLMGIQTFEARQITLGDIGNTRDNQQAPTALPRKCNRCKRNTGIYQYEIFPYELEQSN